jgi:hypothetical protein
MRKLLSLVLLLAACRKPVEDQSAAAPDPQAPSAAAAEEAPPEELAHLFWSSVSETGTGALAEVRQTATARGRCRVSSALGAQRLWSADACIATRKQMRFVSADGVAVVVLDPLPDSDETKLGTLWREGRRVVDLTPTSLRLARDATRSEGGKVHWLGPRDQKATPEGVQVELINGSPLLIRFDGRGIDASQQQRPPQAVQAVAAAMEAEPCSPCSYTDSAGVYHLVENASEIPPQYRKQAGRIRGSIQRIDALPAPQSGQPVLPAAQNMASSQQEMTEAQARKALLEEARNRPAQPQIPDPNRNSLGENFIEYNTRIANQAGQGGPNAPPPKFDAKAKCIDNSGASVPCSETGMQAHQ